MSDIPVTGALAEYRGRRFRILFGGDDWVALAVESDVELPDGFADGESPNGPGHYERWVKVPRTALDLVVQVRASGTLRGHNVSLRRRLPDGRIGIEFVGPPSVARELGLDGDQYLGWTGLVDPDELENVQAEETPHV
jgi:hypothetical protein